MIILRLRGGLGNQLFQYAAGKALAEHHGTDFKLDLYYYKKHPYRSFDLNKFNVPLEIASRREIHRFTGSNPLQRFLNKRENYLRCPKVFAQPHYHFYADWLKLPADLYLSGYFQSEKFFASVHEKVQQWYSLSEPLDSRNEELRSRMRACQSVALHVRRGDYKAPQFNAFFGTVPESYYKEVVGYIKENVNSSVFFIFSDDIAWCKSNLDLGDSAVFVDWNSGADSHKDLVMMSCCSHNVIANSTFSWWGAWLNKNPSKIIVAPRKWFNLEYYTGATPVYPARHYNTVDLIPPAWKRM